VRVAEGERWVGVSTGGGGYGSPVERPAAIVARDVRDGVISREAAEAAFGVVLGPDLALDEAATAVARERLAAVRRPLYTPSTPSASTWVERNLRAGDVYLAVCLTACALLRRGEAAAVRPVASPTTRSASTTTRPSARRSSVPPADSRPAHAGDELTSTRTGRRRRVSAMTASPTRRLESARPTTPSQPHACQASPGT